MDQELASKKRRIDDAANAPGADRFRPTLPVRRLESAIFGGWGPRL